MSLLSLPDQIFTLVFVLGQYLSLYVTRLLSYVADLPPMSSRHQTTLFFVPPHLSTWSYVLVRDDSVRDPLTPPHKGPYKFLDRTIKCWILDVEGSKETVSTDRVKHAFNEALTVSELSSYSYIPIKTHTDPPLSTVQTSTDPNITTRGGQHVRWPKPNQPTNQQTNNYQTKKKLSKTIYIWIFMRLMKGMFVRMDILKKSTCLYYLLY